MKPLKHILLFSLCIGVFITHGQTLNQGFFETMPYIYTPNNTYVTCTQYNNRDANGHVVYSDITTSQEAAYEKAVKGYNGLLVKQATSTYNCHGFAWFGSNGAETSQYGLSPVNYFFAWIDNSEVHKFLTSTRWSGDNSYSSAGSPSVGDKLVFYASTSTNNGGTGCIHSANVVDYNSGGGFYLYRSKWGPGPLVDHKIENCPYYVQYTELDYFYSATQLGSQFNCYLENLGQNILNFKWNINTDEENIEGFNVVKLDQKNQITQTLNSTIIPRKDYGDININGESYSWPLNNYKREKLALQVLFNDGQSEIVQLKTSK